MKIVICRAAVPAFFRGFSRAVSLCSLSLGLGFGVAWPQLASGQTSVTLPDSVVTATRSTQLLSAALAHTTLISRDDIERSGVVDVVTLLEREAGLQRTQNGGVGTVSSVFLRGAPSLQTLVLIDGIPQNKQDASGAVSLEHIMLDNVERIEIVRGNVSAVYGSGAIGGVIQIFTRNAGQQGGQRNSAAVSLEIGPNASSRLSASSSLISGATSVQLGISRFKTEGFSAVNPAQLPSANPDSDGYANTSANVALTHTLAPGHQLGVKWSHADAASSYDNYFGAPQDIQTATTALTQASVFSANQWGRWNSRLTLSQNADKSTNVDNGVYGSTDGFTTEAKVLSWVNTYGLTESVVVTAGLEQQNQHVDTNSTSAFSTPYDQNRTTRAVFGGLDGQWGAVSWQVNLRNDTVGDLQKDTSYLGLGYAITSQIKATASTSTAFNAPPLGYLFAPGYGNPLLKPELARSDELGLQYNQAGQLLRATYFDTRVQDQLTYDTTTFAFANLNRTKNSGVELSYRGTVGANQWRASYTDQDPVDEVTGEPLQRRARQMASVGVSHTAAAWQMGGNLRWSGARSDKYSDPVSFDTVKVELPSYTVMDFTVSYQWSSAVRLNARLDNALNASYQTVYGYAQQPRSLYAGLTWSPKR